jgi:secreted trypsin-like serine protease
VPCSVEVQSYERVAPILFTKTKKIKKILLPPSQIDNEWILTAAHCCTESVLEDYRVRIGAHNLASRSEVNAKTLQLARLVLHPDYEPSTFHQDLCLLKTVQVRKRRGFLGKNSTKIHVFQPIIFNAEVSPVCLADALDGPVGQKCWVTGWGGTVQENYTFSNNAPNVQTRPPSSLRQVDVVILERSKCQEDATITPEMFCAQAPGKDSCQGDSGGALVCQDDSGIFKQVGVVSSGS